MNDWLEVHALLDDQLPAEDRARVQERINTCPLTQAEWRAVREIKTILVEKCVQPDCDEVWLACSQRLIQIEKAKKAEHFVGKYAWALCASFCAIIVVAAGYTRMNGGNLRPGDLAGVDASLVSISAPRSQTPSDQRDWLQQNLSKTMHPTPSHLTVLRGAIGHLPDGRRVSEATLEDSAGDLNLFVVERANKVDDVEHVDARYSGGRIGDKNCITWTDSGNAYLLAGDRSLTDLCQTADGLSAKQ
jgi:hypothetical protein